MLSLTPEMDLVNHDLAVKIYRAHQYLFRAKKSKFKLN